MSTRSTRKRKNEEEELVELPEDSDAESEEEYVVPFFSPYSFLWAQTAQSRAHATTTRLLARNWTPPVASDVPMATRPAHLSHNNH